MTKQDVNEIELRKWCLEFIMDQKEYLGVSDLVLEAEKLLDFVKGEEVNAFEEHTFVKYPLRTYTRSVDEHKVAPLTKGRFLTDTEVGAADLVQADSFDWSAGRDKDGCLPIGLSSDQQGPNNRIHHYHYSEGRTSFQVSDRGLWIDQHRGGIPLEDPITVALIKALNLSKGKSDD